MFALLLVPLMLMVGLSIDVGSWYNRASDIQKAADAAALAGVVWLPNVAEAEKQAIITAKKNGFDNADPNITVTVKQSDKGARRLHVEIRDEKVGSFFYEGIAGKTLDMSRDSYAEYALPVPMGSPENYFGGNSWSNPGLPAAKQANLWGNIHGPRTDNYKGDLYAAGCRSNSNCSPPSNPNYRSSGYLYIIDVPAGVSDLDMQVFDAGMYDRGSDESVDTGDRRYGSGTTTVDWIFYDKDSTELDVTDNVPAASTGLCTSGAGTWAIADGASASTYKSKWTSICQRSGSVPEGQYLLRVKTRGTGDSANRYALRVNASSTVQPRLYAHENMSMFNNISSGSANFYLAEVDQVHAGKTLKIQLYDPGEVSGSATIKILTPSGAVASTCSASATAGKSIPSTLTPCQFKSSDGGAKFDGSEVTLLVPIDNSYTCTTGALPGCWWKIRYEIGGQATDTTTWSASIIGDPIHLVEEN